SRRVFAAPDSCAARAQFRRIPRSWPGCTPGFISRGLCPHPVNREELPSMFTVTDSNPTPGPQAQSVVYQHTKRAQWGLAALVWERDGKRGYRFEDGSERVFREGFYHLLEPRPAVGETAEK